MTKFLPGRENLVGAEGELVGETGFRGQEGLVGGGLGEDGEGRN